MKYRIIAETDFCEGREGRTEFTVDAENMDDALKKAQADIPSCYIVLEVTQE